MKLGSSLMTNAAIGGSSLALPASKSAMKMGWLFPCPSSSVREA